MSAELLEELIAAGTPARLVAKVAALAALVDQLNQRRAVDAARQQRNRQAKSRNVTQRSDSHVTERDVTPQAYTSPKESSKPKRVSRSAACKTGLPADFALEAVDHDFARGKGWSPSKIAEEFRRFVDHARATGRKQADWHAAWRNWVTSPYQQENRANGHREPTIADSFAELRLELAGSGGEVEGNPPMRDITPAGPRGG